MPRLAHDVATRASGEATATTYFDLKLKKTLPCFSKVARRELRESEFIPYSCHYDEHTILTKSGDLLQVIKIDGLAFETADPQWLNFQKDLRNTMLRSIAKSEFALYFHTIRRRQGIYPQGEFPEGFSRTLNEAWKKKHEGLELYVNDFYITILHKAKGAGIAGLKGRIESWLKRSNAEANQALQLACKELSSVSARFLANLKDYGARLLGLVEGEQAAYSEPARFFSQLINLEDRPILAPAMGLDRYLPSQRLLFGKEAFEIRGIRESKVAAMISVKEYGESTYAGIFDHFLRIPAEFIVTQSFVFSDRQASLGKIQTQQRKMLQTEDLALSQVAQIDEALDDATAGRIGFGYHHLTVLVRGKNNAELDQGLAQVEAAFLNLGIVSVREDLNLEPCFWAQLPGNFQYIARSSLLSTANLASLASLHNYPSGKFLGNHWGPALTVLETISGTPYFFNFHVRDVGHTTIIGPTGTGKSVLLNFLLSQCFKYKPKVFFFDKDRGGEIFVRAMRGVHSTLGLAYPSGFNPLQLPDSPENRAFLGEWLQLLLTTYGESFDSAALDIINDAIEGNYKLDFEDRCLENIAAFLGRADSGSLASRLTQWYGKGLRANLFGNREDILKFDQDFFGFEMGEILEDKTSLPSVLAYLFHRINLVLDGHPTIIVLEEGWKLLDNPYFAPKIKDWLQTLRKRNAMVIFLTPNIESAVHSTIGDTLVQQSSTSIFLPNHKATKEGYCEAFKLSEQEYEIIRSMNPADRCFLIKHGQDSIIARLDLSGMEDFIRVLSGTAKNITLLDELRKEKGSDPAQWMDAFQARAS